MCTLYTVYVCRRACVCVLMPLVREEGETAERKTARCEVRNVLGFGGLHWPLCMGKYKEEPLLPDR